MGRGGSNLHRLFLCIPARSVSPQQTRNIIAKMLGADSADKQLKAMLERFCEQDGNEVFIMHDQMDMMCAVVIQSRIQKAFFEQWGEALAMDWTHGTNNLGYYLGELQRWANCNLKALTSNLNMVQARFL
jgi:hypothetical protein